MIYIYIMCAFAMFFLLAFSLESIKFSVKARRRTVTYEELNKARLRTTIFLFITMFLGLFVIAVPEEGLLTISGVVGYALCVTIFPGLLSLFWYVFPFKNPLITVSLQKHHDDKGM